MGPINQSRKRFRLTGSALILSLALSLTIFVALRRLGDQIRRRLSAAPPWGRLDALEIKHPADTGYYRGTNLGLPGMDGWEATTQIRANPNCVHVPIIALTAHNLAEDVRRAVSVGFDGYETKPLIYGRLMNKIKAFVR